MTTHITEREADLHAESEARAKSVVALTNTLRVTTEALTAECDAYAKAADDQAMAHKVERDALALDLHTETAAVIALRAENAALKADAERLDFQQSNLAYEFSTEDNDGDLVWVGYKVTGSRNDREWHKVAVGATLREAIDAAMKGAS